VTDPGFSKERGRFRESGPIPQQGAAAEPPAGVGGKAPGNESLQSRPYKLFAYVIANVACSFAYI